LVEDDTGKVGAAIRQLIGTGVPTQHRSSQVAFYRERIRSLDPTRQLDPKELRASWQAPGSTETGK
jgi:hypothetical protein